MEDTWSCFGAFWSQIGTLEMMTISLSEIKKLIKQGDSQAVDMLTKYLNHHDWRIREAAVVGLGEIGGRKTTSYLIKSLNDSYCDVRIAACEALGNTGDKKVIPHLVELMGDPEDRVRKAVFMSLEKLGEERLVEAFLGAVYRDTEKEIEIL